MTDHDKAIEALRITRDICSQADLALRSEHAPREETHIELAVVQRDLMSLLSLVYNATTKLSVALKPSSPAWEACISPLKDLTTYVPALSICLSHFDPNTHGATLTKEVVSKGKELLDAITTHVNVFLNLATGSGNGSNYLFVTGQVHELITEAKDLSSSNGEAVKKRLHQDLGSLEDALREVREMTEQPTRDDDMDQDGCENVDWEEVGLPSMKMDKNELERANKVYTLLRYTTLLQDRSTRLVSIPYSSPRMHEILDQLPPLSTSLLSVTDGLVCQLYAPQNTAQIFAELESWLDDMKLYEDLVSDFWRDMHESTLEVHVGEMSLQDSSADASDRQMEEKENEKWFEMCFNQIFATGEELKATLGLDDLTCT